MKNVIAINSSNRKKNTYSTLKKIEKILNKQDINLEIINLYNYKINECIGCMKCIENKKCIYEEKDQMIDIMNKLINSDGIILSSPVYMRNVSGRCKTFVDRTCKWYHCSEIYGKPSFVVSTTAGSGLNATLDYLEDTLKQWGTLPTGRIGLKTQTINRNIKEQELYEFIKLIKEGNKSYKPSLKYLMDFQVQKVLSLKIIDADKEFWMEKGWNKSIFFVDCNISLPKIVVAKSFYKFFNKVLDKK